MQRFDTRACIEIKYCRLDFYVVLYAVILGPISSLEEEERDRTGVLYAASPPHTRPTSPFCLLLQIQIQTQIRIVIQIRIHKELYCMQLWPQTRTTHRFCPELTLWFAPSSKFNPSREMRKIHQK